MTRPAPRLRLADYLSPSISALISVIVNYAGTFVLVFQAAHLAQLSAAQTASWVWSVSIGVGVTGAWLSYRYREPIITAWSTPGVAFLATVMPFTPYAEVIGAYVMCALGFIVLGLSGAFERLVRLIPGGIAAGLLAGILLQFGVAAFGGASADPLLVIVLVVSYAVLRRFTSRYAMVGILLIGLGLLLAQQRLDLHSLELQLAAPVFEMPHFSIAAFFWRGLAAVRDYPDRAIHPRHAGAAQRRVQDQRQPDHHRHRPGVFIDGTVRRPRVQCRSDYGGDLHRARYSSGPVQTLHRRVGVWGAVHPGRGVWRDVGNLVYGPAPRVYHHLGGPGAARCHRFKPGQCDGRYTHPGNRVDHLFGNGGQCHVAGHWRRVLGAGGGVAGAWGDSRWAPG